MSLPVAAAGVRGPLVLTLAIDERLSTLLTDLRKRFFPPHRNHLEAHITLFHAIPAHRLSALDTHLRHLASSQQQPFDVSLGEPKKMGWKGVMLMVRDTPARSIEHLHSGLRGHLQRTAEKEEDQLTPQDMQGVKRGHVVVLNKAESAEEVEGCFEEMSRMFDGHEEEGKAVGLDLWEYCGGPWKFIKRYHFGHSS